MKRIATLKLSGVYRINLIDRCKIMVEGTVKFFNEMKHFGFIAGDDGKEYFVHISGLKDGTTIREGDKVSFEVVQGDKGEKAEQVEKI